jgi:hypothetical protein
MKRALAVAVLVVAAAAAGCSDDDNGPTSTGAGSNLSESQVIDIVKAHLAVVSRGGTETRTISTMVPCPPGSNNPSCVPCSPSSPNLCRPDTRTEQVEGPARCPFPPGPQAAWSADYNANGVWDVESSEPATGLNRWTVDDETASILSGYCYP